MQAVLNFFATTNKNDNWFYTYGRLIVSLVIFLVPVAYDHTVAEVAGDIRWYILHLSTLTLLTMFFAHSFMQGHNKINTKLPFTAWVALFLAIWIAASFFWSMHPFRSWWFGKHFVSYIALFGFIFMFRDEKWYRNLLWLLAAGVGFNSFVGILQFHDLAQGTPLDYFRQSAPPAGTLSNKNLAGSYLVLMLPIVFYLLISTKHTALKVLSAACFTLGTVFLVYTRSRGSWVAIVCSSIFLIAWLAINKSDRQALIAALKSPAIGIILSVSAVVIIGLSQFTSPLKGYHSIDKGIANQVETITKLGTGQDKGLETRIAYNLNGWEILKDNPFGVGIGAFHTIYPAYYAKSYKTPPLGYSISARPQRMHNDIGQAFVELGWPGGISYLLIFGGIAFMVWRLSRDENHKKGHEAGKLSSLFIMIGIVGLGANSLGDFPLQMPTAPALLWAFAGMLTGVYVINTKQSEHSFFGIKTLPYSKYISGVMVVVSAFALFYVAFDSYKRHKADNYLKYAMSFAMQHKFGDNALQFISAANKTYPYNSRTYEYLGVIYANHPAGTKISISSDHKIAVLEEVVKYDIYAPNNLINLLGLYNKKAEQLMRFGDVKKADVYLDKGIKVYNKLLGTADFAHQTYTVAGMTYLLKSKPVIAMNLFEKSLSMKADFYPAQVGAKQATVMLKMQGKYEGYVRSRKGVSIGIPSQPAPSRPR